MTDVHRTLRRIKDIHSLLERAPKEVILQHLAGRLSHADMMAELKTWPYTFRTEAEPSNPETAWTGLKLPQLMWDPLKILGGASVPLVLAAGMRLP